MKSELLSPVRGFRESAYQQFSHRADTLFEMMDALLVLPSATAPAYIPGFQRS